MRMRVAIDRAETVGLHRRLAKDKPGPGRKNAGKKGGKERSGAAGPAVEGGGGAGTGTGTGTWLLRVMRPFAKTTNYGPNRHRPASPALHKLATKCLHFYFIFTFSLDTDSKYRSYTPIEMPRCQSGEEQGNMHSI